ncbi:MAG: acyl-CoA/acyl-ACP dehydrogenase [Caulobacteraceae bacterium]|nr:acyl-CoA/acyl-ACP dehydrogenase [Caulobacteraceae bacterium]
MELRLSEEQEMLTDLVRRICQDSFPTSELRAAEASEAGYSQALWSALVEHGICGAQVSADFGGLGLGATEGAVIYEELGRALANSPHFSSCVLAANLIALGGDAAQRGRWLPAIASGEARLTVASLEPAGDFSPRGVTLAAVWRGDEVALSGAKHFVPFGAEADRVLVLARARDPGAVVSHVVAVLVDPRADGVTCVRQRDLAGEPHVAMTFKDVRIPVAEVLNGGEDIWPHWRAAMFQSLIPLAAQAVGAADQALAMSVAYAKEREAFGRPIGGFQSIAHDLAEALVAVRGARVLVHQAAWARDTGRPFERLAAMAKYQACAVFRRVSALTIQVHGGLGYTTACDAQLYYRRAKQWQILNWDHALLEDEIGELTLGRRASAPREAVHV